MSFAGSIAAGQTATAPAATGIAISGSAPRPVILIAADLAALPHQTVSVIDDDRSNATYDRVALDAVLARAGVTFGEAAHGARLLDYVVVTAGDGYRVLFALAELDPEHGPFRVIVPDEKRHARWIRNVNAIAIAHAATP